MDPIPFNQVVLDVNTVLAAFHQAGVDFVIVGGIAAVLIGSPLATEDIDVTVPDDADALKATAEALTALGAQWRVPGLDEGFPPPRPLVGADLAGKLSVSFVTRAGFVDVILHHSDGADHSTLLLGAKTVQVYGKDVRVASLDSIIASKEAAARTKDAHSLPFLYELRKRLS